MCVNRRLRSTLTFIALLAVIETVYASYWIYSNQVSVTVSSYALTLSPASQTVNTGDTVAFIATLKKDGSPASGATINLYISPDLSTIFYSNTTTSDGTCKLYYTVSEGNGSTVYFKAGYNVP
jgi:hypothetical protein